MNKSTRTVLKFNGFEVSMPDASFHKILALGWCFGAAALIYAVSKLTEAIAPYVTN